MTYLIGDPRIRSIPFITRRPTFSQIKSVQLKLATVYSGLKYPSPSATRKTQTKTSYTETHIDAPETHTDVSGTHTDTPESHTDVSGTHTDTPETHTDVSEAHVNVLETKAEISPFNESDEERDEFLSETCTPKIKKRRRKKKEKKEVIDPLVMELHTYCRHGDVEALLKLLRKSDYQLLSSSTDQSIPLSIDQLTSTDQSVSSSIDQLTSTDQSVSSSIDQLTSTDQSVSSSTDQLTSTDQSISSSADQPVASSTDQPVVSSIDQPTSSDQEFKLDVNSTIDNITALHVASSSGHVDVIRVLLLHGANPIIKYVNYKLIKCYNNIV